MDPSTINKLVTPIMELFQERMSGSSLVLLHQETMLVVFLQVVLVHCTFQTADVSFRVARMLLVEHTVTMHEVEPSALSGGCGAVRVLKDQDKGGFQDLRGVQCLQLRCQ